MALGVRININIVDEWEKESPIGRWLDLLRNPIPSGELKFIRLPGISQSGPCSTCAAFFGMEHDGSGSQVPVIPVHENCCCLDSPTQLAELTEGGSPAPLEKGDWLKSRSTEEKQQILGKGRTALLESGAITLKQIYARRDSPLSYAKPLRDIAGELVNRASKARLVQAAKDSGIGESDIAGATRAELINLIARRKVLNVKETA